MCLSILYNKKDLKRNFKVFFVYYLINNLTIVMSVRSIMDAKDRNTNKKIFISNLAEYTYTSTGENIEDIINNASHRDGCTRFYAQPDPNSTPIPNNLQWALKTRISEEIGDLDYFLTKH